MLGNWWVQQGLLSEEFKRWSVLCDESHAQEIH